MKKLVRLFINVLAVIIMCSVCFTFTACEDIKTLEITVSVYDKEDKAMQDKTLSVSLYRHLAPKTVDTILGYVEEGYYDNTFFYKNVDYSNQIMVGDYKYNNGVELNQIKPYIEVSEFANGGTVGSDLVNDMGYIGLWRTWKNKNSYTSTVDMGTGRATLYMPTTSISGYNDNFCVFGKFDVNGEAWLDIKTLLSSSTYYTSYTVFYTGEFDRSKEDSGLTFNVMKTSDFTEEYKSTVDVFDILEETSAYNEYAEHKIYVPIVDDNIAAYIKSVKIK